MTVCTTTRSSVARRGLTADGLIAKANAEQLAGQVADKMRARCKPMGLQPWRKWVSSELAKMPPLMRSMILAALKARAGK